ncbi:DoxX family protein [Longispora albida]|uniref:DoxX family protein n=1 Tax=Longispora albida TaxID=203523 RepID=UPI00037CEA7F|nr:DoxX family protein [Longispora albida]
MFAAYLTVTILTAFMAASAAVTYFIRHPYPTAQMDMKRLPHSWMPMLGTFLAAGSAGLVTGIWVPLIGILAAAGLVLYFILALAAHLRVGSRNLVGWAAFTSFSIASLVLGLLR